MDKQTDRKADHLSVACPRAASTVSLHNSDMPKQH
uniref:Uncharacterized protein n=1 Tax=Anguilla anguilla TaxID=7936 RepID=A0A0E9RF83_ANGAN